VDLYPSSLIKTLPGDRIVYRPNDPIITKPI